MRIKGTHKKISGEMGTLPFTSKTLERFRRQKLPGALVISLTFHLIAAVIAGLYYPGNTQHQYTNRNLVTADIIDPLAPPEPMVRKPVIKRTLHSSTVVENRHVQRRSIKAKYAGAAASFDVANPQAQGLNRPNDAAYPDVYFQHHGTNPFIDTEDDPFSTFAMDVDTASYAVARRYFRDGHLPPKDAVRVEEFVNAFDYGYTPPMEEAFAIHLEAAPSKFGEGKRLQLLRIGIQGRVVEADERKDARLTFVIDVSGSMCGENRLGLVKRALRLLVEQLRPKDEVGIVIYGTDAEVVLPHTRISNREHILETIESLHTSGVTNAEDGLRKGYELALQNFQKDCINRVILCSDGVANEGITSASGILKEIETYVKEGIMLTTVGFGMGNYNDELMEQLANKGNGMYAYVDTLKEAKRIFVENLTGTLQVIAKDAKIQVKFNPEAVSRFRLLGYEKRSLEHEDFRNDDVDAGEVGAGHSVTALYEIKLHENAVGTLATVFIRHEDPDTEQVTEIQEALSLEALHRTFEEASPAFQLATAVAHYAEILRDSYWARKGSLETVKKMLKGLNLQTPQLDELIELVRHANHLKQLNDTASI